MVATHKANADAHPGLVVLASQQRRRSKHEILADKAWAKADAIAAREAILTRERELLERIGSIEDTIQREDDALQTQATRPDLRYGSKPSSRKHSRTMSKAEQQTATSNKKKKITDQDHK
jgi:hypothetical protein